jgi:hypothetical protein
MRYKTLESSAVSTLQVVALSLWLNPSGRHDGRALPTGFERIASDCWFLADAVSPAPLTMYCYGDTKKQLVKNKPRVAGMVERWQYVSINMNTIFSIQPRRSSAAMN